MHGERPLVRVAGHAPDDGLCRALARTFTVERHRSFDHDPRLGLIALAEIAGRALAPAANDPGTAIDVLNALFRTPSRLPPDTPQPDEDRPPVNVPRASTDDFIRDGFTAVVREGVGEDEVAIRAFKILSMVGNALPHFAATTDALAAELSRNVARTVFDEAAIAHAGPVSESLAMKTDAMPHSIMLQRS